MKLDSTGHFTWTPSFDFVSRPRQNKKELSVIFEALLKGDKENPASL